MNARVRYGSGAAVVDGRSRWMPDSWVHVISAAVAGALCVLAIGVTLAMFVVPKVMGGEALTVLSPSMEPAFAPGDIMVIRGIDEADVCTDVTIGDIVTYFPTPNDPTTISHRVVAKSSGTYEDGTSCRLVPQGDNNDTADDAISPAQVRGVFMYGAPKVGYARQWVDQNKMMAVAAIVALALLVYFLPTGRRKSTTILPGAPAADAPAGAGTYAAPVPPAGYGPSGVVEHGSCDADAAAFDRTIREREMALREREMNLRYAQFAAEHPEVAVASAPGTSPHVVPTPVDPPHQGDSL